MVDRLVEGAADAGIERVARGAKLVGVEDEPAVLASAADGGIGLADSLVAAGSDIREREPGDVADGGVGDGAAADERVAFAAGGRVAGSGRGEVEAAQAERGDRCGGRRASGGRSLDDLLDRQDEDARGARRLESRQQAPDLVRSDHGMDRDHARRGRAG